MSIVEFKFCGNELYLSTRDMYAMGVGIDILHLLDAQPETTVKNTGWKNGFGLKVAVWLPIINSRKLSAEVSTDGNEFRIRKLLGTEEDFVELYDLIVDFLEEKKLLRRSR